MLIEVVWWAQEQRTGELCHCALSPAFGVRGMVIGGIFS